MEFKFFVGVDISKLTLDFVVRDEQKVLFHRKTRNDAEGLKSFEVHCKAHQVDLKQSVICMEHTGIYNACPLAHFHSKGYSIWVENPIQIKQSMGLVRGKNDKVDAQRISEYAFRYQDKIRIWVPERAIITQIRHLSALRRRLINTKNQLQVPLAELKGQTEKSIKKKLEKFTSKPVEELKKKIKEVDKEIHTLIQSDERLNELFEQVTSVDGVGEVLFCEMIITTNEFKDITEAKKFACYSAVAPFEHTSGTSMRGKNRVSKMGNKSTKRLLHMAAMSTIARKGELYDYYQRKVAEGKSKMSVLNAVRNKLIHRVFACVRDGRKYEKIYTHALA